MDNEKPQFKVSYDLEVEYLYKGKTYKVRVGAHRNLTNPNYFPKIVKCIGTVMHKSYGTDDAHEFPASEVVKMFCDLEGVHLVGARWTKDFSDVEYEGDPGELWEDERTVYLRAYAMRFRSLKEKAERGETNEDREPVSPIYDTNGLLTNIAMNCDEILREPLTETQRTYVEGIKHMVDILSGKEEEVE